MEIKIEAYAGSFTVSVNGKDIGTWTYIDGAIEAARKELQARYIPHTDKCQCEICR
jgi:hypothetical protein